MLGILSNTFKVATRIDGFDTTLSQEERHANFLAEKRKARKELKFQRDQAFYRRGY